MGKTRIFELLGKWHSRIRATQHAHYEEAAHLGRRQLQLGIPIVVLSTIAGTSVLSVFSTASPQPLLAIGIGLMSVVAAVLASLQTFLNYPAKQTTHLLAATRLSGLKKRIEEQLALENDGADQFMREVMTEWNAITQAAPLLSQSTFDRHFSEALPKDVFAPVLEQSKDTATAAVKSLPEVGS